LQAGKKTAELTEMFTLAPASIVTMKVTHDVCTLPISYNENP